MIDLGKSVSVSRSLVANLGSRIWFPSGSLALWDSLGLRLGTSIRRTLNAKLRHAS